MLVALLALQVTVQTGPPPRRGQATVVRDSSVLDSASRRAPRRLPVTSAVLASAFSDASARDLFNRARIARTTQDSSLQSYDAKVRQRISVGMGIGKLGRDRLMYRAESAARVQWDYRTGAWIDLTGARVAIPIASAKDERDDLQGDLTDSDMSPIPYFPGYEALWIGGTTAKTEVNEREIVNPLAGGAEAYYTYESGDSITFRLPDGHVVRLRELQVRPRSPKWNLAVGSLWFDIGTGQLVRAAYRLSVPIDAWVIADEEAAADSSNDKPPAIAKAFISPLQGQISAIAVEYGLYEGQFWLPRIRSMEGFAQAMFMRVPIKIENAFTYNSVNKRLDLPPIRVDTTVRPPGFRLEPPAGLDSAGRRAWRDSALAVRNAELRARRDSVRAGQRTGSMRQCDTSDTRVVTRYRYDVRLPVGLRIPCDIDKLINSPDFTSSIYDPADELFGSKDRDRLIEEALSMAAQAPGAFGSFGVLPPARYQYGLSMTRYNRVEGLSTGLLVEQQLGAGYLVTGVARLGAADLEPNGELSVARTNLSKTVRLNAYNRLVSASDWGNPLSFGSSLSAFLFGRDEGFYYRASGAEVLWTSERGARLEWRAFGEQQRAAVQKTTYSVGGAFVPNITTTTGLSAGAAVRFLHTYGLDPQGFRVFTDLRLEGAGGDSTYGRGAMDVTLSRGLGSRAAAALTIAGGSTLGQLPPQRRWFLGGTQTIRGQSADTAQSGNAFWLGRAELARTHTGYRFSLFGDLGWAGDRTKVKDIVRPMSGVGVGWSMLDGLLRFDVARGIYPRKQTRVDAYFEARF